MPWFQPSARLFQIKIDWELNGFSESLINCFIFSFLLQNCPWFTFSSPLSNVARVPAELWRISFLLSLTRCFSRISDDAQRPLCWMPTPIAWPITRRCFSRSRDAKLIHTNAVYSQFVAAPFSLHSHLIAFGYSFSLFPPTNAMRETCKLSWRRRSETRRWLLWHPRQLTLIMKC